MTINNEHIHDANKKFHEEHLENFNTLANRLTKHGHNVSDIVSKLS